MARLDVALRVRVRHKETRLAAKSHVEGSKTAIAIVRLLESRVCLASNARSE
jgi:hypothetical protein